MNNFFSRTITGILFVILIVGSILLSQYLFASLFLVITILGILEFNNLVEKDNIKPQKIIGIIVGSALFVSSALFALNLIDGSILLLNIPLFFVIFIIELFRKTEKPFTNIAYTLLGIIYVALPFSLLNFFFTPGSTTGDEYHPAILLGFFLLIWMNDTTAYLIGIWLGKHRFFERISPKKSWEGFIGGTIFTLILAYILSIYFDEFNLLQWLIITIIVVVFGVLGDLVESIFKRSINCKDSGTIFPGHGGILDRFDSVLLATPFVFTYVIMFS